MNDRDGRQQAFEDFSVPDRVRISKAKKWFERNGHLSPTRRISVLEIGYARGGFLDNLAEYGNIAKYAVDINDRQCGDDISFHKHDCNRGLPDFGTTSFDIVFAGEVIEHVFDDRQFLSSIRSVLKPRGTLCLTTPNLFFLATRIAMPFGRMPFFAYAPYHYHFYSVDSICKLVSDSGFDITEVTSSHILFSSRRNRAIGRIFEALGDAFPKLGAHVILFATKR